MKTLILFGAGASHDSGHTCIRESNRLEKPPLGKGLFCALQQRFPETWGKLSVNLGAIFKMNFEDGMSRLMENKHGLPSSHVLLIDLAIYFSHFGIINKTQNLYYKLFRPSRKKLRSGEIRVATLNYECLIEESLGNVLDYAAKKKEFFWLIGHTQAPYLYKVHGSCNYLDLNDRVHFSEGITFQGNGLPRINVKIEHEKPEDVIKTLRKNRLQPCFSIYMQGKPTYIEFQYIEEIQREYLQFCNQAEQLICVGARFVEQDSHVWDPLINGPAKLYYVGDETSFANIKARKNQSEYLADKFEPALLKLKGLLQ